MKRMFLLLALAVLFPARGSGEDKLDDGLDGKEPRPVFVRMTRQIFTQAGDYESFCEKNAGRKSSDLRREVLETLKRNSDESWKAFQPLVVKLQGTGAIRDLQRYWIVNGFACRATGDACRELARDPNVSFVYLQRLKVPLHRVEREPEPATTAAEQRTILARVLADWKDDSGEAVTTAGWEVPWNLARVKAEQAWVREGATGRGVVVAMIDSGLLITPSLTGALWRNPGEELNGKDDDGNGYVDDVFGWDFGADASYVLGDSSKITHGSMCAGIVAGRPLNGKKLVTGVAPRARLMILRNAGGSLKAYEYALSNGANVMSMSFMWVGIPLGNYRGLYRLAHEHMAAAGIVAVGGAGNFALTQPEGRQIATPKDIPCVIAAAGIMRDGSKARPSSEGPCYWTGVKFYDDFPREHPLIKPDVTACFTGYPVWGRPSLVPPMRGRWRLVEDAGNDSGLIIGPGGNSFSGPHAAGVAALMLSANPELTAWQVKSFMEQTCADLGPTGRDTTYGAGLLDALQAVQAAKKAKVTWTRQ